MPNTIQIRRSSAAGVDPTALEPGELAVNVADETLWVGNDAKSPVCLLDPSTRIQVHGWYKGTIALGVLTKEDGDGVTVVRSAPGEFTLTWAAGVLQKFVVLLIHQVDEFFIAEDHAARTATTCKLNCRNTSMVGQPLSDPPLLHVMTCTK